MKPVVSPLSEFTDCEYLVEQGAARHGTRSHDIPLLMLINFLMVSGIIRCPNRPAVEVTHNVKFDDLGRAYECGTRHADKDA